MFIYYLLLDESQSSEGQVRKSVRLMTHTCVQIRIPTVICSFPSHQVTMIFFSYHLMFLVPNSFSNNSKCTAI